MAFPLRSFSKALQTTAAHPRAFSSSTAASTSKLSPLNKTVLARAKRDAKGDGKGKAKKSKEQDMMTLEEAARVLKAWSPTTPNAAYEINILTKPASTIQLNALRGRVFLPHSASSLTKTSFIVVFATGAQAKLALAAGADRVGGEELVAEILSGELSPDKLITTPELLNLFTRNPALARFLGPKGLMPSVRRGTVAEDLTTAVQEARGGLDWKGDSKGVIRAAIGRLNFTPEALQVNVHTLLASISDIALGGSGALSGTAPRVAKRPAITRVLLSSTQGPGIVLADV